MEILKLLPAGKDYFWGGTRLRDEFGKKLDMTPLAETWECSVHPDGLSIVANGRYAGETLAAVLKDHPEYLGTKAGDTKELPVLVKFIDVRQNLSVQVHPDDHYAGEHEGQNGKSEMWYVVDADEDASLIYGFAHPVTEKLLSDALAQGILEKHLRKIKAQRGDVYFIPAGVVHSIGAGTLVVEIQESSNVTYRVYDYERLDQNGQKREIHFDKAVAVMDMGVAQDVNRRRCVHVYPGYSREVLCQCKYFETERIVVKTGLNFSVDRESFRIILCLDGEGQIETEDRDRKPVRFQKGDCLYIPAGIGRCHLSGETEILRIRC